MTVLLGALVAAIVFVGVAIVGAGRRVERGLLALVEVLEAARTRQP